jgi:hypothetical protein
MPAKSIAQRRLMAIAEHNPSAVYPQNRGILSMTHQQMHDFASTKEKGLAGHVASLKKSGRLRRRKGSVTTNSKISKSAQVQPIRVPKPPGIPNP